MRQQVVGVLMASAIAVFLPAMAAADVMSREEIQDELFGVTLSGIIEGTDIRWRECIDGDGDTLYEVDGGVARRGILTVTDDGMACFAYGGLASCFTVERDGAHYAFVDAMDRFLVQQVERPVRQCGSNDATS